MSNAVLDRPPVFGGFQVFTRQVQLTTTEPTQFIDVTDDVEAAVRASGIRDGIAVVYSAHTTAGIAINEDEPLLLGAAAGLLLAISAVTLVPWLVVLTASSGRGAPLHSGLIGLAGLACAPLLIVPLALSLVGAPLAAILGVALVICWWIGAASFGFLVGRRLLRLVGREGSLTRAALRGGALLGALIGIPVVGGVFIVLFGAVGAGALLLALIEGEFGPARAPEATIGMVVYE